VQPATGGRVRFNGADITHAAPDRRVSLGIIQVPEGRQVFAPLTVEDNLRLGAYRRGGDTAAATLERIYAMFPRLRERRASLAGTLSGGEQQMLAMGRAVMAQPQLLLLDEPSMGLAPLLVQEVFAYVRRLKDEGRTIFLVDQNARAALAVADRAYVLETGLVVLSGTGAELAADAQVQQAYLGL
jgi:branched-chain amino acid transport system ATP-binding protein